MNYTDLGYNKYLYKTTYSPSDTELAEDESSQYITSLTGTSITGGITRSPNGRLKIDWEKGQILINDGAHDRVLIGLDIT